MTATAPLGRMVTDCLDCGHGHGELQACLAEGCDCTGGIDSQSTLYCPTCLGAFRWDRLAGVTHCDCEFHDCWYGRLPCRQCQVERRAAP